MTANPSPGVSIQFCACETRTHFPEVQKAQRTGGLRVPKDILGLLSELAEAPGAVTFSSALACGTGVTV